MLPIEKCEICPRWKLHVEAGVIPDEDMVCALCQATSVLLTVNDHLENKLVRLKIQDRVAN